MSADFVKRAARRADLAADVPVVTLATAHPAKFGDAVERATGVRPTLPGRVGAGANPFANTFATPRF